MVRLKVTLSNRGEKIVLNDTEPFDWFKEIGAQGFGIAPTALSITQSALGGGLYRNTRRLVRDIDLPIVIFGNNGDEISEKMSKLVRIFNDKETAPKITVQLPDGSAYSTEFYYASGADAQHGTDTNHRTYARWPVTLRCPDPYWTAENAISYSIRSANAGRGLIKSSPLTKLRLSSSQALGVLSILNPGHVEAFPLWTFYGPGDSFTATRDSDEATFTFNTPITVGQKIIVDTKTKRVVDGDGANRYADLDTSPRLFGILAGNSTVTVEITNATGDSLVTMNFRPRREFVF